MIQDRPVIAWTPWGRRQTTTILYRYMARDHAAGIIDAWYLYINTDPDQEADVAYAHELAASHDWIHIINRPPDVPVLSPKQRMTGFAYRYFTNPNAVYVRFDDDIVYVHDDAVERLVSAKLAMSGCLVSFPVIINNAVVSHHLQMQGLIPREWGDVSCYCMDRWGWADGNFAINLHRLLLDKVEAGRVDDLYMYQDIPLPERLQFSVSTFACLGSDYATLDPPGWLGYAEEESFHTIEWPAKTGKVNMIVGNAVVSQFTFGPQRRDPQHAAVLNGEILDRYRALADKL